MIYDLLKAVHLMALFVWVGGMVAAALALRHPGAIEPKALGAYDRAVTTPAMILALAAGIGLGVLGEWFSSAWLGLKIVLVLVLSGLHGALVGRLRRAAWEAPSERSPGGALLLPIGLAVLALIVLLVTTKAI